jgi:hypothetical protein
MKIMRVWSTIGLLAGGIAACVTFRLPPLPPPGNLLEEIQTCQRVEEHGGLFRPAEVQSEFTSQNRKIYCFIRLENITREIRIRWNWYDPAGSLVRTTKDIYVNSKKEYLETVTAYDMLSFDDKSAKGIWTVALFVDGEFLGKRPFRFEDQPAGDASKNSI